MPADVLSAQGDLSVAVDIQRRVQCAAVAGQQLGVGDALAQLVEMPFGWQIDWRKGYELRQCLLQRLHTAQATTAVAGQLPPLLLDVPERPRAHLHFGMLRAAIAPQTQVA